MRKEAIWIVPLIVTAALVSTFIYKRSAPKEGETKYRPELGEGVRMALQGENRITSSEEGRRAWTMTSTDLAFHEGTGVVEVDDISAVITLKEGGTVEVRGLAGSYFQDSQDMELEGEVKVRLTRAGRLEWEMAGDTASYRREEDTFYVSSLDGLVYPESGETVHVRGRSGAYDNRATAMRLVGEVEMDLFREGRLEWEMAGDTASFHQKEEMFYLSKLVGIYHPAGGGQLDMQGGRGVFNSRERKMRLEGNVVCVFSEGMTLWTGWLDYDSAANTASTEDRVKVEGKGWTLGGVGLIANMAAQKVSVLRAVKIRMEKGLSGLKK